MTTVEKRIQDKDSAKQTGIRQEAMISFRSIKVQLNLFLAAFAIFLFAKEPHLAALFSLSQTVLFSVLLEGVILFRKDKKFHVTASSITSGLILGLVLSPDSPWWTLLVAAAAAIGLKYLVRFHGKNLLNPAALGIFLAILPFKGNTAWQGTYLWYILIPAGLYFVGKIRKMAIVIGYFGMSLLLFIPQALSQGTSLWNIPGYFNYFFIFIMLIEPKTTPAARIPKIAFGTGVALLVFLLTEWAFPYEPEISALLVMNACVPLLNKLPDLKFSKSKQNPRKESL
ncbi:MAG: RnfABCDGE type electron transport complex subunit D [Candidatus Omnitrophota bacterium]